MIRIGDFSRLSRVSVKTLRYYDEMNLLKPIEVDRFTSYRYYSFDQLPCLNRILALKDMGFSLKQISQLLSDSLSPEHMRCMLKQRQVEIQQMVEEERERLVRVEIRLRQIEQEKNMPNYDVVIKKIESLKVAVIRDIVSTPPEQGSLWHELEGYLAMHRVHLTSSPCLTLYHDDEYKDRDWDLEVCEPIAVDLPQSLRVKVRTLPTVEIMACTIHHGPFVAIQEAYGAILKWIDANGYHIIGPGREVYQRNAAPHRQSGAIAISQTDPNTVTEIQFPVE